MADTVEIASLSRLKTRRTRCRAPSLHCRWPGPAAVELPPDVLRSRFISTNAREAGTLEPPRVEPGAIAEALRLLAGANRPMIMVGAGAIDAGADLRSIAERPGAPGVSHLQGRGILDSRHPLSVGRGEAFRIWRDADVILAVGTRFNSSASTLGPKAGAACRADRFRSGSVSPRRASRRCDPRGRSHGARGARCLTDRKKPTSSGQNAGDRQGQSRGRG